jgi:hypothetical protein
MGTAWQMPIAVIGKPTGDGRQFDAGALGHRDLPLPLRYVASDSGGHSNAVIVGHIAKIGKEKDGMLPAKGEFYDDESWPEDVRNAATAAMKFTQNKVIGPSVDLDQQEVEHVPEPKAYAAWKKAQAGKLKAAKMAHGGDCGCGSPVMADEAFDGPRLKMIRSGRLASATLVHIPAFAELSGHAKLTPIDSSDPNVDGTTSSAMVAGALVEIDWSQIDWGSKIENDAELFADQDELAISEDASDDDVPNRAKAQARKKTKRDPETVKGSQDTQEMALDDESGIWLTDDEFTEFAKRRLPSPTKQKTGGAETPGGDGEQGQGGGGLGGGTYAVADSVKTLKAQADRNKLGDEDFVDPKGRRFPIADCSSIGDAVSSYGRADPKIPYGTFKARLTAIAKRKGCEGSLPDNWKAGEKMAALMAGAAPAAPPKEWFDDPKLTAPTPLHIGDDGRVYGHVAVWDTCHVGIGSSCVKPPKSNTSYAYFHTGEAVTAEGDRVAVGRLTYGDGGHAAPNLGFRAAAEHYDKTSHMGAVARAGEDAYGIWVAGALVPEADEAAVRVMRSTPLSGDWRRVGGNLEMVAALHVNTAGFPIPRTMTAGADEQVLSLVAAGALAAIDDDDPAVTMGLSDTDALGRAIARGMLAEQQETAQREARTAEWRELVAAATREDHTADYDEAVGDLLVALAQE